MIASARSWDRLRRRSDHRVPGAGLLFILSLVRAERMIHYTCDRCKAEIDPTNESRYVVEVDVQRITAGDDEPLEAGEVDSLSQLHHALEGHSCGTPENGGSDEAALDDEPSTHHAQYDLCPRCYRLFRRNPLGREASFALHFSKN